MTTHMTISHGSDFDGVDIVAIHRLRELSDHLHGVLPAADLPPLSAVLGTTGHEQSIDTGHAAHFADLLRSAAEHRALRKPHRDTAALLSVAAATAAARDEPWTWTPTTERPGG
ncbi:hypothetical protein AB0G74_32470 [Streptomyces sp. NPDC020875]|uniref:DUF7739 domain-containing protein n=1 Tax=Streptomyces sp. NPDC020875 TaxID=3154898 RepID=UPI0033DCF842